MTGLRKHCRLMVVAVSLLLAGCVADPPPPPGPSSVQATPTSERTSDQIVIGVDSVAGGYHPHLLADASTITSALARLLLPSVFRIGADGGYELDKTLMRDAEVIEEDPFTVAYTIRQDASWSDGAPIAAEDFRYLAEEMRTQPGTVNPAGYRLISEVTSLEGGKRVEVVFAARYPGWRGLFADLLPSHLLKDVPGGWQAALEGNYPASGGPYAIRSVDTARGEILIVRNERYWAKPSAVEQLILRGPGGEDGAEEAAPPAEDLRTENLQFALTRTDAGGFAELDGLSGVELHTVPRPYVAEVLLRPTGDALSDSTVRAAVAALIDRDVLVDAGTGGGPESELAADAQVLAPSQDAYAASVPQNRREPDPGKAARLLSDAGYQRDGDDMWRSADGEPLSLVIASPGEQEPYARIASELAEQLTAAGVTVLFVQPDPRDLYAVDPANDDADPITVTVDGAEQDVTVDVLVGPRPVSADPASDIASRFGCRTDDPAADSDAQVLAGNVAGFCDQRLEPKMTKLLTGQQLLGSELAALESRLWQADVSLPLFQLADTLAVGRDVAGVAPGPPLAGPFGGAVNWNRITE